MLVLFSALIGLLAGLHAAAWGMYKDSLHEGFSVRRFVRSPVAGLAVGAALGAITGWDPRDPAVLVIAFGTGYAIERALAEVYKTFVREEDQAKYAIPMQLSVLGRPVRSRAVRLVAGAAYLLGTGGVIWLVDALGRGHAGPSLELVLATGGLGGWISAFGGAWKDAPIEGFQPFKFLRSPAMATGYALLLMQLTAEPALITLAATGLTIATTETWKTFAFPSSPRGKFAGKPVHFPEMRGRRRRIVPLYAAIWALVLASLVAGLANADAPGEAATVEARHV
jgi:hypothetical protein